MEMNTYQEKVNTFAANRKLIRLQSPIDNSFNLPCDVCESTRPTLLFALREPETGSFYFVGNNCLSEISKRGAVVRRSRKESAELAFRKGMRRRENLDEGDEQTKTAPETLARLPRSEDSLAVTKTARIVTCPNVCQCS